MCICIVQITIEKNTAIFYIYKKYIDYIDVLQPILFMDSMAQNSEFNQFFLHNNEYFSVCVCVFGQKQATWQ